MRISDENIRTASVIQVTQRHESSPKEPAISISIMGVLSLPLLPLLFCLSNLMG